MSSLMDGTPQEECESKPQKVQIDEVAIKSYVGAIWEEPEYAEIECGRCGSGFHSQKFSNRSVRSLRPNVRPYELCYDTLANDGAGVGNERGAEAGQNGGRVVKSQKIFY